MNTFKRKSISILPALLLALGVSAGESALADTCEVRLGQSSMDFGQISNPGANAPTGPGDLFPVGTRFVSLNASCPSSSKLLLILRGDGIAERFRFATNGQLKVRLSNALLDGRAVDLAQIKAVGDPPGKPASTIEVSPGDLVVPVSAGLAAAGTLLSMQIEISPSVSPNEFQTNDRKSLEGNLSVEVRGY